MKISTAKRPVRLPKWLKNDPHRPNQGKTYSEYLDEVYGKKKKAEILRYIYP